MLKFDKFIKNGSKNTKKTITTNNKGKIEISNDIANLKQQINIQMPSKVMASINESLDFMTEVTVRQNREIAEQLMGIRTSIDNQVKIFPKLFDNFFVKLSTKLLKGFFWPATTLLKWGWNALKKKEDKFTKVNFRNYIPRKADTVSLISSVLSVREWVKDIALFKFPELEDVITRNSLTKDAYLEGIKVQSKHLKNFITKPLHSIVESIDENFKELSKIQIDLTTVTNKNLKSIQTTIYDITQELIKSSKKMVSNMGNYFATHISNQTKALLQGISVIAKKYISGIPIESGAVSIKTKSNKPILSYDKDINDYVFKHANPEITGAVKKEASNRIISSSDFNKTITKYIEKVKDKSLKKKISKLLKSKETVFDKSKKIKSILEKEKDKPELNELFGFVSEIQEQTQKEFNDIFSLIKLEPKEVIRLSKIREELKGSKLKKKSYELADKKINFSKKLAEIVKEASKETSEETINIILKQYGNDTKKMYTEIIRSVQDTEKEYSPQLIKKLSDLLNEREEIATSIRKNLKSNKNVYDTEQLELYKKFHNIKKDIYLKSKSKELPKIYGQSFPSTEINKTFTSMEDNIKGLRTKNTITSVININPIKRKSKLSGKIREIDSQYKSDISKLEKILTDKSETTFQKILNNLIKTFKGTRLNYSAISSIRAQARELQKQIDNINALIEYQPSEVTPDIIRQLRELEETQKAYQYFADEIYPKLSKETIEKRKLRASIGYGLSEEEEKEYKSTILEIRKRIKSNDKKIQTLKKEEDKLKTRIKEYNKLIAKAKTEEEKQSYKRMKREALATYAKTRSERFSTSKESDLLAKNKKRLVAEFVTTKYAGVESKQKEVKKHTTTLAWDKAVEKDTWSEEVLQAMLQNPDLTDEEKKDITRRLALLKYMKSIKPELDKKKSGGEKISHLFSSIRNSGLDDQTKKILLDQAKLFTKTVIKERLILEKQQKDIQRQNKIIRWIPKWMSTVKDSITNKLSKMADSVKKGEESWLGYFKKILGYVGLIAVGIMFFKNTIAAWWKGKGWKSILYGIKDTFMDVAGYMVSFWKKAFSWVGSILKGFGKNISDKYKFWAANTPEEKVRNSTALGNANKGFMSSLTNLFTGSSEDKKTLDALKKFKPKNIQEQAIKKMLQKTIKDREEKRSNLLGTMGWRAAKDFSLTGAATITANKVSNKMMWSGAKMMVKAPGELISKQVLKKVEKDIASKGTEKAIQKAIDNSSFTKKILSSTKDIISKTVEKSKNIAAKSLTKFSQTTIGKKLGQAVAKTGLNKLSSLGIKTGLKTTGKKIGSFLAKTGLKKVGGFVVKKLGGTALKFLGGAALTGLGIVSGGIIPGLVAAAGTALTIWDVGRALFSTDKSSVKFYNTELAKLFAKIDYKKNTKEMIQLKTEFITALLIRTGNPIYNFQYFVKAFNKDKRLPLEVTNNIIKDIAEIINSNPETDWMHELIGQMLNKKYGFYFSTANHALIVDKSLDDILKDSNISKTEIDEISSNLNFMLLSAIPGALTKKQKRKKKANLKSFLQKEMKKGFHKKGAGILKTGLHLAGSVLGTVGRGMETVFWGGLSLVTGFQWGWAKKNMKEAATLTGQNLHNLGSTSWSLAKKALKLTPYGLLMGDENFNIAMGKKPITSAWSIDKDNIEGKVKILLEFLLRTGYYSDNYKIIFHWPRIRINAFINRIIEIAEKSETDEDAANILADLAIKNGLALQRHWYLSRYIDMKTPYEELLKDQNITQKDIEETAKFLSKRLSVFGKKKKEKSSKPTNKITEFINKIKQLTKKTVTKGKQLATKITDSEAAKEIKSKVLELYTKGKTKAINIYHKGKDYVTKNLENIPSSKDLIQNAKKLYKQGKTKASNLYHKSKEYFIDNLKSIAFPVGTIIDSAKKIYTKGKSKVSDLYHKGKEYFIDNLKNVVFPAGAIKDTIKDLYSIGKTSAKKIYTKGKSKVSDLYQTSKEYFIDNLKNVVFPAGAIIDNTKKLYTKGKTKALDFYNKIKKTEVAKNISQYLKEGKDKVLQLYTKGKTKALDFYNKYKPIGKEYYQKGKEKVNQITNTLTDTTGRIITKLKKSDYIKQAQNILSKTGHAVGDITNKIAAEAHKLKTEYYSKKTVNYLHQLNKKIEKLISINEEQKKHLKDNVTVNKTLAKETITGTKKIGDLIFNNKIEIEKNKLTNANNSIVPILSQMVTNPVTNINTRNLQGSGSGTGGEDIIKFTKDTYRMVKK